MYSLKSGFRSANQLAQVVRSHRRHFPANQLVGSHLPVNQVRQLFFLHHYPSTLDLTKRVLDSDYEPWYERKIKPPMNWGVVNVPEKQAFVVERNPEFWKTFIAGIFPFLNRPSVDNSRLGRRIRRRKGEFRKTPEKGENSKTLFAGIHFLNPFVDRIVRVLPLHEHHGISICFYGNSYKEEDKFRGFMAAQIVDPKLATYGSKNPFGDFTEVSRKIVRKNLHGMTKREFFVDCNTILRDKIAVAINEGVKDWGMKCTSLHFINNYEIFRESPSPDEKVLPRAFKRAFTDDADDPEYALNSLKKAVIETLRSVYSSRTMENLRLTEEDEEMAELETWAVESLNSVPQQEAKAKAEALAYLRDHQWQNQYEQLSKLFDAFFQYRKDGRAIGIFYIDIEELLRKRCRTRTWLN